MAGKCLCCGKYVSNKGGASCCKCLNKFHLTCVNLPETARVSSDWQCKTCRGKPSKNCPTPSQGLHSDDNKQDTPTSQYDSSQSTDGTGYDPERSIQVAANNPSPQPSLSNEMQLLRMEIREMREDLKAELREFRLEVADLRQSLTACKKKVETLENRLDHIEKQQATTPPPLELEQTITQLKAEINEREQEVLLSDIEITNLPEYAGENIMHTVELVAKKLCIPLDEKDIVYAERVGPKVERSGAAGEGAAGTKCRRVVVRLARRGLRDELLKSARTRRGVTSADLDLDGAPRRFYVNERLTRTNKQLFFLARQTATQLGWRFVWTKHGRIYAREADGKRAHAIRTEPDITRVFGCEPVKTGRE